MSPDTSTTYPLSAAMPVVAVIAASAIVAIAIAAWLIREVARNALEKSAQTDIPEVLTALGGLLDSLRLFLPWHSGWHRSLPADPPGNNATTHTGTSRDLPEGGRSETRP